MIVDFEFLYVESFQLNYQCVDILCKVLGIGEDGSIQVNCCNVLLLCWGSVMIDSYINQLLVIDMLVVLVNVCKLIECIDVVLCQVFIEVCIVEVDDSFLCNFGVKFGLVVIICVVVVGNGYVVIVEQSGQMLVIFDFILCELVLNLCVDGFSGLVLGSFVFIFFNVVVWCFFNVEFLVLEVDGCGKIVFSLCLIMVDQQVVLIEQGEEIFYQ